MPSYENCSIKPGIFPNDIPVDLHKKSIVLSYCPDEQPGSVRQWMFSLALIANKKRMKLFLPTCRFKFKVLATAKNAQYARKILACCYDNVYSISASKLEYDKGKIFLLLCYNYETKTPKKGSTKKDRIMAVHIGISNAISAGYNFCDKVDRIDGADVKTYAEQIELRRQSVQFASAKNSKKCGDGRCGHGCKTKLKSLKNISSKISNFRNTINHQYSRAIVDWATENRCGTIILEDASKYSQEITDKAFLKNWTYYDLATKITYKAKAAGISVIMCDIGNIYFYCPACGVVLESKDSWPYCATCNKAIGFEKEAIAALMSSFAE